jgi:hypothetical protein
MRDLTAIRRYSSVFLFKVVLCAGVFAAQPLAAWADDLPLRLAVPQKLVSGESSVGHVSVATRQGLERIVLRRRATHEDIAVYENGALSQRRWDAPVLFEGYTRERGTRRLGAPRAVRGDVVQGRLRLYFEGRRSPRRFVVRTSSLHPQSSARVFGAPLSKRVSCAHSLHGAGASPAVGAIAPRANALTIAAASTLPASTTVGLFSPPRVVELGIDADYELFQRYGSATLAEMRAIVNAAEAFYTEQLGLSFKVKSSDISTNPSLPSASTNALVLLDAYRNQALGSPLGRTADIFHLFSGKGSLTYTGFPVVGLAGSPEGPGQPGPVCLTPGNSVGLSQRIEDSIQAIVTAHEIGHNLGATHPDQSLPSQNLPRSIMSSEVASDGKLFAEYSRGEIATQVIDHGDCLAVEAKFVTFGAQVTGRSFQATFAPTSALGTNCTTSIYASKTKRDLQRRLTGATRLNRTAVKKGQKLTLKGVVNNSGSARPFYLRAVTACTVSGRRRVQGSPIVTVKARDREPVVRLRNRLK